MGTTEGLSRRRDASLSLWVTSKYKSQSLLLVSVRNDHPSRSTSTSTFGPLHASVWSKSLPMWRKHHHSGEIWHGCAGVRWRMHRKGYSARILPTVLGKTQNRITVKPEFQSDAMYCRCFENTACDVRDYFGFESGGRFFFFSSSAKTKTWNSAESNRLISGQWQKQSNWQSFDCENRYSGAYFHQGQWNVSYHAHSSLPRTHIEGCSLA